MITQNRMKAKIMAGESASGTPGGPELARSNVERGVLYHYTHIPTFVSHYSQHFFTTVAGK